LAGPFVFGVPDTLCGTGPAKVRVGREFVAEAGGGGAVALVRKNVLGKKRRIQMKLVSKLAIWGAMVVPMAAAPASAQTWKWDFNVNAGYSYFTKILDAEQSGIATQGDKDLKFKSGGLLGSQLTFWVGKNLGIRFNGTYADRPLITDDLTMTQAAGAGLNHVNLWSGSGDLLFRFATPKAEYTGMEVLPYLALGIGAKWHNPAGDAYTCNDLEEGKTWSCAPFTLGGATGRTFALSEANTLMGLVGLGADWRIARNLAIRTEISDRIWDPRLHPTTTPTTGTTYALASDLDVGDAIHEISGQVGLSFLFGVARPTAVAAVEPAPIAPTPVVTPTVSREAMSVCVVDPTAAGGIRMQEVYLVGGRDTVVVVGGSDRPFNTSVGTVTIASNSDWFVRGQPLTITSGTSKMEYISYGSPRVISNTDLAFLGTVNGMAVYADRNDVKDVYDEIEDLRKAQGKNDLGEILGQQKDLRDAMNNVKVLYVPSKATGCEFQAVQRQEEVRKGGK
jgi:hypothetical protein